MKSPPRPPPNLMALVHLLAGALLGAGLVGLTLLNGSNPEEDARAAFRRALDWGILGTVGGLLGGIVAGLRTADGSTQIPGLRFWMLALGAGGALTLGTIALRQAPSIPTSESGGPATYVLMYLLVGWMAGVLLGAVGAAFAQAASPAISGGIRGATSGRPRNMAMVMGVVLSGAAWAIFWAIVVALLALLALVVVMLSVRAGGSVPALAVGAACGTVFFALRYALCKGG